jgi:hypothetical protein
VASVDSGLVNPHFRLQAGKGEIRVHIPFVALTPGYYRMAAGFSVAGQWLAYNGCLLELYIVQNDMARYHGLMVMDAQFEFTRFSDTR